MNFKAILQTKTSENYQNNISILLENCSHKQKVEFALYCAQDLELYYDKTKYPEIHKARLACLTSIADWLLNPSKANLDKVKAAANAATNAANAAANAATNAAYAAAYAATNAANAAAYAATNAANAAAYAATNAAYAAAYAAAKETKLKELYEWLFLNLTKDLKKEMIELLYGI